MSNKFDELAKGMALSVTRRGALKKFGVGVAGIVLASLRLANRALAGQKGKGFGNCDHCNPTSNFGCTIGDIKCYNWCYAKCIPGGGG